MTVGVFREWLLDYVTDGDTLIALAPGLTLEMAAAVSRIMANQDLVLEARAYAVAREFSPLLVNTVVGLIGPEYLYDGNQIIRGGRLESPGGRHALLDSDPLLAP
jgi:ethanolamine ammonia-lyase large subunit